MINIEFDPEDVDSFIQIADAIEEAFPKVIVNGNEEGPGRPGSFEVSISENKLDDKWAGMQITY